MNVQTLGNGAKWNVEVAGRKYLLNPVWDPESQKCTMTPDAPASAPSTGSPATSMPNSAVIPTTSPFLLLARNRASFCVDQPGGDNGHRFQ